MQLYSALAENERLKERLRRTSCDACEHAKVSQPTTSEYRKDDTSAFEPVVEVDMMPAGGVLGLYTDVESLSTPTDEDKKAAQAMLDLSRGSDFDSSDADTVALDSPGMDAWTADTWATLGLPNPDIGDTEQIPSIEDQLMPIPSMSTSYASTNGAPLSPIDNNWSTFGIAGANSPIYDAAQMSSPSSLSRQLLQDFGLSDAAILPASPSRSTSPEPPAKPTRKMRALPARAHYTTHPPTRTSEEEAEGFNENLSQQVKRLQALSRPTAELEVSSQGADTGGWDSATVSSWHQDRAEIAEAEPRLFTDPYDFDPKPATRKTIGLRPQARYVRHRE